MRALTIDGPAQTPRLRDVPDPRPGAGEVLVAVRASALTGADVAAVEGRLLDDDRAHPHGLGLGWAGVVEAVGDGVADLAPGARVLGVVPATDGAPGAWSERLVVPVDDRLAPVPDGVDDRTAGALGLLGVVAMNLVGAARAREGRSLLVDGDVLGLAPLVVALAAARGADVVATGTGADEALLREQGAAAVIDPGDDVVAALRAVRPRGVHALVDLVDRGHDDFRRALEVLDDGGYAVSAFGAATGAGRPDVDVTNVLLEPVPGQLAELAGLVADGRLRVPIAAEIALDDVVGALQGARARRERGAVVVTIAAD